MLNRATSSSVDIWDERKTSCRSATGGLVSPTIAIRENCRQSLNSVHALRGITLDPVTLTTRLDLEFHLVP